MGRNAIETVLGAVVLAVAGLFMVFAYSSADLQKVQGYTVNAYFPMVDGIKDGTDVRINGVKVGSVSGLSLVTKPGMDQFKVRVQMTIMPAVVLPVDTIAMIASESLLGGKYLALEVGVEDDTIKTDGTGRITRTQAPMRLDDLIGQVIYGSKRQESSSNNPASPSPAAAAAAPSHAPLDYAVPETARGNAVAPAKAAQPVAPVAAPREAPAYAPPVAPDHGTPAVTAPEPAHP